jgi:Uma2 family endonuclease
MSTATLQSDNPTALEPRQCFIINSIDWANYRKISDALTDRHVRLTYDRGVLEFMTKSTLHEMLSRLYHLSLFVLAEEFGLPLCSCGSMTCDREDLSHGVDADESIYLHNAPLVRGKKQIDLSTDPPPDLMVEVNLSRSSQRRLSIYAAIKVPEVWQVDTDSLKVLQLQQDGQYAVSEQSCYFPGLPMAEIVSFVRRRDEVDEIALIREFRAWVRDCLAQNGKNAP